MPEKNTPSDVAGWLRLFSAAEIPILRQTVRRLHAARQEIDRVTGRDITEIVLQDPLLAIRVIAYLQEFGSRRLQREITTVASAVMMLGVNPFFDKFESPLTVESVLSNVPQARLGVLQVILRAQRASRYAHDWAFARYDMNVEEVALAALLHDLAEILLWCFGPDRAIEIRARQRADPTLRSAIAQQEVLGYTLADLQLALCESWHLPNLLTILINDDNAHLPRVRNVKLAVQLARHSIDGWRNPAIASDLVEIENLLQISRETLLARLHLPPSWSPNCWRQRARLRRPADRWPAPADMPVR